MMEVCGWLLVAPDVAIVCALLIAMSCACAYAGALNWLGVVRQRVGLWRHRRSAWPHGVRR